MTKKLIERISNELGGLSPEKQKILEDDIAIPAKIIGIGQAGVGKTELLKSIFRINEHSILASEEVKKLIISKLKTGAVKSVTKDFYSFSLRSEEGLMVQFTDGPGLGESRELREKYLKMWINEIPKNNMLYWVLDASSRDIEHIQENMKFILDETGYRNKLVVVLNKVDQILLPQELELKGVIGWDTNYNQPTPALLKLIEMRTEDIIDKLVNYADIERRQIVICSARKRWNHGEVLDKILEYLPENIRIKASLNREVKDFTELMSEVAKRKII